MKIFIDVDNTILEHTTFYNSKTEGRLHKIFNYDPVSHESAIQRMYEGSVCSDVKNLQYLFEQENVYILTKTSNTTYEKYKRIRLAKLFEMSVEEMISKKDSEGKNKYVTVDEHSPKSSFIMNEFNLDSIHDCILVDDYSQNLIEWEYDGGIAVKFHNEYNSCFHPTGGIVVSNFKLFTYLFTEATFDNILIDTKLVYFFNRYFEDANLVDVYELIENDIMRRFNTDKRVYENTKNEMTDFLSAYYKFIEHNNMGDLKLAFNNKYDVSKTNIIINPFDYTHKFIKAVLENKNYLSFGYSRNEEETRVRDVYISTPTHLYADYSFDTVKKAMKLIKNIEKSRI